MKRVIAGVLVLLGLVGCGGSPAVPSAPTNATGPTARATTELGGPTLTPANDTQAVSDALLAYVRANRGGDQFRVEVGGIAEDWAYATALPADGSADPTYAFLQRSAGTWQVLIAGTAFDPADLRELGVPDELIGLVIPPTSPTDQTATGTGGISGALGYPSEIIPNLRVYIVSTGDATQFYMIPTEPNQTEWSINGVAPGEYNVLAYLPNGSNFAGGYTQAVPCGLTNECTDHTLLPMTVQAGQTTPDISPIDWYADAGTFPAEPAGTPQPTVQP